MEIAESTWDYIQMISVSPKSGQILGFISGEVCRSANKVCNISLINYAGCVNGIFSWDIKKFFDMLFSEMAIHKITFCVVVGNPAEHIYDKLCKKYGVRIVGTYKDDMRLMDNKLRPAVSAPSG
jgi:hypothetical protein